MNHSDKRTPFQRHRDAWSNCERCGLASGRTRVCLLRGSIPCDALFIGEAPGASEDVLGRPFVGPAGHLLDKIIDDAVEASGSTELRRSFTNLVGCIPVGDDGAKTAAPPKSAIDACLPRLVEVVALCRPRLVVFVGQLASKWGPKAVGSKTRQITIIHPAAILRADPSQQLLMVQRATLELANAFAEL